jgi:hypothetical protein
VSDSLVRKLRSQIGDDVQEIYSHEALFRLAADQIEALEAQLAQRDAALKAADDLAQHAHDFTTATGFGVIGMADALAAYRKARGQDA